MHEEIASLSRKLNQSGQGLGASSEVIPGESEDDPEASFSVTLPVASFDQFTILEEDLQTSSKRKSLVSDNFFKHVTHNYLCKERQILFRIVSKC